MSKKILDKKIEEYMKNKNKYRWFSRSLSKTE